MSKYLLVQKLLSKVAVRRFMQNFRRRLSVHDLKEKDFSMMSGRHPGAFNKTINEAEDLRLSSFLRYWNAALSISTDKARGDEGAFDFNELMDDEVRKILNMIKELSPSDLGEGLPNISSKDLMDLKVYVDLLVKQKAVSEAEQAEYFKMIEELKQEERNREN